MLAIWLTSVFKGLGTRGKIKMIYALSFKKYLTNSLLIQIGVSSIPKPKLLIFQGALQTIVSFCWSLSPIPVSDLIGLSDFIVFGSQIPHSLKLFKMPSPLKLVCTVLSKNSKGRPQIGTGSTLGTFLQKRNKFWLGLVGFSDLWQRDH